MPDRKRKRRPQGRFLSKQELVKTNKQEDMDMSVVIIGGNECMVRNALKNILEEHAR